MILSVFLKESSLRLFLWPKLGMKASREEISVIQASLSRPIAAIWAFFMEKSRLVPAIEVANFACKHVVDIWSAGRIVRERWVVEFSIQMTTEQT